MLTFQSDESERMAVRGFESFEVNKKTRFHSLHDFFEMAEKEGFLYNSAKLFKMMSGGRLRPERTVRDGWRCEGSNPLQ